MRRISILADIRSMYWAYYVRNVQKSPGQETGFGEKGTFEGSERYQIGPQ